METKILPKSRKVRIFLLLFLSAVAISTAGYLTYKVSQNIAAKDSEAATTATYLTNGRLYGPNSPFSRKIPTDAIYTKESRIGSVRGTYSDYTMPYVRNQAGQNVPLVKVTNIYTGTADYWPIPITAAPNTGEDAWLGVLDPDTSKFYEFWLFQWDTSTTPATAKVGGNWGFPLGGIGISLPGHTVSASGLAVSGGSVIKEDFTDPITGKIDTTRHIEHALEMGINFELIKINDFVAPATQGEDYPDNIGGIPLGAMFALPKNFDVESLNVHPLTKAIARAMRDYGVYASDRNGSGLFKKLYTGTIPYEASLTKDVFGIDNDVMLTQTQEEMYNIILQAGGLYRVTGVDFSYTCDSTQTWDASLQRCKAPGSTVCYKCTDDLTDLDACVSYKTTLTNCPIGTSFSPTGCTSTGGGSCPNTKSAITCYRCSESTTDGNACESFIANGPKCPTGSSSKSAGCAGATLSGACPVTPPACTSFTYSDWSACVNGKQTRTVITASPIGCAGGTPVTQQNCKRQ